MTKTHKPIKVTTKISSNNQTYVPKAIRDHLGLTDANDIEWIVNDQGKIQIEKKESFLEWLDGVAGVAKDLYKEDGGGVKWLEKERKNAWRD